jgi:hypothetical protein
MLAKGRGVVKADTLLLLRLLRLLFIRPLERKLDLVR